MAPQPPILGRESELATLERALGDPDCGGVALVGAAGVGKTWLARRAGELAVERGLTTSVVRATSSASRVPFAALSPFLALLDVQMEGEPNVYRAVRDRLTGLDAARVVVVVDDAHELDDASAALLDQLVAGGTIFVVLTVRLGEPASGATLQMWKDLHVLRVQVDPLPEPGVRAIAAAALDGPVDDAAMRQLVTASAGNVLFLRELIDGALESGALRVEYGLWRLEGSLAPSARLRDLIAARLSGLADEERVALELAALGEPLPLSVLQPMVTLEAVERLEARRLLEAGGEGDDPEVRLAHPLYGEVVRATLPGVRRTRLSRYLADTVENRGEVSAPDVLRVGVWRLDGGGGNADTIALAARAAFRTEDYGLAERLGRAGWEQWHRPDAALVLGRALDLLGRAGEAEEIFAAAAAQATTDQERTVLALGRASLLFTSLARVDEAARVVAEATAVVRDPACLRELRALEGEQLFLSGEVARAIEVDQPLLRGPADAAFAQASLDLGAALVLAGRTADAIEVTTAGLAVRVDLDDELQLSRTNVYVVANSLALALAGRLGEAAALAEAAYEEAVERDILDGQAWLAAVLGNICLLQGRLGASLHFFRETTSLFGQLKHPGQRWGLGGLALAAGHLGDQATSAAAVSELDRMAVPAVRIMDVYILRGRAWAHVAAGDLSRARAALDEATALAERWGQWSTAVDAVYDLIRIGEKDNAVARLCALEGRVDGELMAARVVHGRAVGSGDCALATQAADLFEEAGALLFAAESAALEHDLARGQGLQRRAAAAAARVAELSARCEGARTPGLSLSEVAEPLTARERDIALLAAGGLTSRQIAERLYLSKRTVDNHLQHVYTKLGVTGRHELAARFGG